jgi:hypothetical protein
MSVHKVIEVIAQSPKGFDDAVREAVAQASRTVKGIKTVWVKDMQAEVDSGGEISMYRVNCKLTFEVK